MNTDKRQAFYNDADNTLFRIRMLAGSGDYFQATNELRAMLSLYNDASDWDRSNPEDDGATLSYVLDMFENAIEHINGIQVGNKSRTAKEAAEYRMKQAA